MWFGPRSSVAARPLLRADP